MANNSPRFEQGFGLVSDDETDRATRKGIRPLLAFLNLAEQVASDANTALTIAGNSRVERENSDEGDDCPISAYGEGSLERLATNALWLLARNAEQTIKWYRDFGPGKEKSQ